MTTEGSLTFAQPMKMKAPGEVEVHMIPHKRWDALRNQIDQLGERTTSFSSAAWAFVGIAVTALASLLSWWPAFDAMSDDLRNQFFWIWVVLVSAFAVGFCVALALFLADWKIQAGRTASVASVLAEMDLLKDA